MRIRRVWLVVMPFSGVVEWEVQERGAQGGNGHGEGPTVDRDVLRAELRRGGRAAEGDDGRGEPAQVPDVQPRRLQLQLRYSQAAGQEVPGLCQAPMTLICTKIKFRDSN